jgi:predicted DNA-binding transcriptional regulator AlpA
LVQDERSKKMQERLLSDRQLETEYGLKRSTRQKKRTTGGDVPFIRIGRRVFYRQSEIERWIASQPSFTSTSEADFQASKAQGDAR